MQLWELRGCLEVLYTTQPAKRRPVYKEGRLKIAAGRADLVDAGGREIDRDVLTLALAEKLKHGDEVELTAYLVQPQTSLVIPDSRALTPAAVSAVADDVPPGTRSLSSAAAPTEDKERTIRQPFKRPRLAVEPMPKTLTDVAQAARPIPQAEPRNCAATESAANFDTGSQPAAPPPPAVAQNGEVFPLGRSGGPDELGAPLQVTPMDLPKKKVVLPEKTPCAPQATVNGKDRECTDLWALCVEEERRAALRARDLWAECAATEDAAQELMARLTAFAAAPCPDADTRLTRERRAQPDQAQPLPDAPSQPQAHPQTQVHSESQSRLPQQLSQEQSHPQSPTHSLRPSPPDAQSQRPAHMQQQFHPESQACPLPQTHLLMEAQPQAQAQLQAQAKLQEQAPAHEQAQTQAQSPVRLCPQQHPLQQVCPLTSVGTVDRRSQPDAHSQLQGQMQQQFHLQSTACPLPQTHLFLDAQPQAQAQLHAQNQWQVQAQLQVQAQFHEQPQPLVQTPPQICPLQEQPLQQVSVAQEPGFADHRREIPSPHAPVSLRESVDPRTEEVEEEHDDEAEAEAASDEQVEPAACDSEDDVPLAVLRRNTAHQAPVASGGQSIAQRASGDFGGIAFEAERPKRNVKNPQAKKIVGERLAKTGNGDVDASKRLQAPPLPLRFAEHVAPSSSSSSVPGVFSTRSHYAQHFLDALICDMQEHLGELAAAWRTCSHSAAGLPAEVPIVAKGVQLNSDPGGLLLRFGPRAAFVRGEAKLCGQGDLWALLSPGQEALLVRTVWRGISPQGKLLCVPVNEAAGEWMNAKGRWRGTAAMTGLCLNDFRADVAQANALHMHTINEESRASEQYSPLDLLAQPETSRGKSADQPTSGDKHGAQQELASLSAEQVAVAQKVGAWAASDDQGSPNVQVVRGVFGSGKSRLLAASIALLDRLLTARRDRRRILLVCQTNVAVDNVLTILMDKHGWDDFARVGSFRNVKAPLLHRTVSLMATRQAACKELSDALQKLPPEICSTLRVAVDRGVLPPRAAAWRKRRLVAATTAALESAAHLGADATGCAFVLVDEATQLTEPAIAACLDRTQAQRLLLIGDPRQLPPRARNVALQRSALERLWEDGRSVGRSELATQYRCHAAIAEIGSRLFYAGGLRTGVSHEGRASMLGANVPPIVVVLTDGIGTEARRQSLGQGSYEHAGEAKLCAVWIQRALRMADGAAQLRPADIGVICLYRPHAEACARALAARGVAGVDSATVDAFQGGEREIIVLSCGRSTPVASRDGFATCPRRLNVALSRSRRHLIVLGSAAFLEGHPHLRHVLSAASAKGAVHQAAVVLAG